MDTSCAHPLGTSIEAVPHEKHMYQTRHQTRASHKSEAEPHLVLGKSSSGTIGTFVEDLAVLVEEAPNEQLDALEDDGTPLLRVQGGAVERRDLGAGVRIGHLLLELVGAAEDLVLATSARDSCATAAIDAVECQSASTPEC